MLRAYLSCGARAPITSRTANESRSRTRTGVASANAPERLQAMACRSRGTRTRIIWSKVLPTFEEPPAVRE